MDIRRLLDLHLLTAASWGLFETFAKALSCLEFATLAKSSIAVTRKLPYGLPFGSGLNRCPAPAPFVRVDGVD